MKATIEEVWAKEGSVWDEEELSISKDDFEVVVKMFKSKQTKSYDFLLKSSQVKRQFMISGQDD